MPLHWHRIKLLFRAGHVLTSGSTTYSHPCRIFTSDRLIFATCANLKHAVLASVNSFFFKFIIYYFILLIFLPRDTYINYIKVPFTGLSTYIALHYLLTVLLWYNWYLCYLHCSTYTTYNVIMHISRGTSFTHTHKKEKLLHKKITVTKDKKAKLWVGLIRVRAWGKKKNQKYNV